MIELTAGAVVRVDDGGTAHWTYEMHTTKGPLGYARRCETSFTGQVCTFLPLDAPTAPRVTCVACLASEG